jgi:hypothetical protein
VVVCDGREGACLVFVGGDVAGDCFDEEFHGVAGGIPAIEHRARQRVVDVTTVFWRQFAVARIATTSTISSSSDALSLSLPRPHPILSL